MSEALWGFLGFLVAFGVQWVIGLIKPEWIVRGMRWALEKLIKDPKALNKTENELGVLMIEAGAKVILETPDDSAVEMLAKNALDTAEELKEAMKRE